MTYIVLLTVMMSFTICKVDSGYFIMLKLPEKAM